ncbi:twitching motility protein PilT [Spirochaetia bacterium]|nr:twitching motility protein PilT [Spirochaetia bacterium]
MKTVLVDLNVILDYLEQRDGYETAAIIIKECFLKRIKGYVCAHEITTLSYFLSKNKMKKRTMVKIISGILKIFEVIEVNGEILNDALYSAITDYEDAVIEQSAKRMKIDYIITKNMKDFVKGEVKSLRPEEYLAINKIR